jgi:phage protein D
MPPVELFGSSATPAVRRPVFVVQFGGAGADGGPGGRAGTVGSALGITPGSGVDAWKQHVLALTVEMGLAPFVDVAELVLAAGPGAPPAAVGDAGTIALGYTDNAATLVFTGKIDRVRQGIHGTTRLTATNGGGQLAAFRLSQSYEGQSAGDIVQALAAAAAVATDTVESGNNLAFYVVDSGRNAYQQIARLARQSDYVAYCTAENKLRFLPFAEGGPVAMFTYGDNLLALEIAEATAAPGAVTVIGEGAAGSQGANAWGWLVKDPAAVTGRAGAGTPERLLQDPALRSSNAAQKAADGASSAAGRFTIAGQLLVPGAPAVMVGSTIEIADAPQAIANGRFLVHRVRHALSKGAGFTTLIAFSKASGGGAGGLSGGLGGL